MPTQQESDATWLWFSNKIHEQGFDSLSSFAKHFGFTKSTLSRYFHRQREIPSGQIGPLCLALKSSPHDLLQAVGAIDWRHLELGK